MNKSVFEQVERGYIAIPGGGAGLLHLFEQVGISSLKAVPVLEEMGFELRGHWDCGHSGFVHQGDKDQHARLYGELLHAVDALGDCGINHSLMVYNEITIEGDWKRERRIPVVCVDRRYTKPVHHKGIYRLTDGNNRLVLEHAGRRLGMDNQQVSEVLQTYRLENEALAENMGLHSYIVESWGEEEDDIGGGQVVVSG